MVDIHHRVGMAASPHELYEALTTVDGLKSWWTHDVVGDPSPGGRLEFTFGSRGVLVMDVVGTQADECVTWRGAEGGPEEWIDTTITFELKPQPDETVLLFTHAGWREPVEFLSHCSTKWASFLLGMKAGFEGDKARPYPDDVKISGWD